MEEYEELKSLVEGVEKDVYAADAGNKAAGTRVRKAMQDIKDAAHAVRNEILELRQADEARKAHGGAQRRSTASWRLRTPP